jgi:hypothetical protein
MSRHPELYHWIGTVASHFPHLSKPMAVGLALWSFGMIVARSCALSSVAGLLAPLLGQSFNTVRERLRDTYREADAKAGPCRAQLEVAPCWAPWLAWVLHGWSGSQLALAIDATTLGQRFVVLAISVVYRGCAVPVAWKILRATEKHPWQPEWLALLEQFRDVLPAGWKVIVLADRGLYARWLFHGICKLGWHPLLRVNQQGKFRPEGWYHWVPFTTLVPVVGQRWQGRGTAFTSKDTQLECTLLGCWGAGHQEAWLVLTDLPPQAAEACWYGLRAWIEQGFKRLKSGGWQWQYTRMADPERAERLWLAIALATWWLLSVGGEAEAEVLAETMPPVPGAARRQGSGWRLMGIFRLGWNRIMAALLNHEPLPMGHGCPEAWPNWPEEDAERTAQERVNEKTLHL